MPVKLYTVEGGWQYLPERIVGRTSREIDTNPVIWAFFQSLAAR